MLSIERRAGECVFIGDEIGVEVREVGHAHVKLAIRAPRACTILRSEAQWRDTGKDVLSADSSWRGEMLILRRRAGESLIIGTDVEVRVLRVRSSRATLTIAAPPVLRIRRSVPGEGRVPAGISEKTFSRKLIARR